MPVTSHHEVLHRREADGRKKSKATCRNRNNDGHYIRDYPEPRAVRGAGGDFECKHCGEQMVWIHQD